MRTNSIITEHKNISEISIGDKLILNNGNEVEVLLLLDNAEEKTFFLSSKQLNSLNEDISVSVGKYNYDLTHNDIKKEYEYSHLDIIKKVN